MVESGFLSLEIKMRNDEAFSVVKRMPLYGKQPIGLNTGLREEDQFFIPIPARLMKEVGLRTGEEVVITVDEHSWDRESRPVSWQLTIISKSNLP